MDSQNLRLQRCEPGIAAGALVREPVFGDRGRRPVSAELEGNGEFSTPGLAFEDYSRMRVKQHKLAPSRKLETPTWALNHSALQMLIVRFVERRAGIREPGTGSHTDRLANAQAKLRSRISRKTDVLDRLCRKYVVEDNPARKLVLQTQIKNLDAVIRTTEQAPALIAGIIFLYYRCGMPSNAVASELGIQPPAVRQILYRLKSTWQEMQNGRDARPSTGDASAPPRRKILRNGWRSSEAHPSPPDSPLRTGWKVAVRELCSCGSLLPEGRMTCDKCLSSRWSSKERESLQALLR